jgi:hypothetical protein
MEDYAWGVLVPELGATIPTGPYAQTIEVKKTN